MPIFAPSRPRGTALDGKVLQTSGPEPRPPESFICLEFLSSAQGWLLYRPERPTIPPIRARLNRYSTDWTLHTLCYTLSQRKMCYMRFKCISLKYTEAQDKNMFFMVTQKFKYLATTATCMCWWRAETGIILFIRTRGNTSVIYFCKSLFVETWWRDITGNRLFVNLSSGVWQSSAGIYLFLRKHYFQQQLSICQDVQ